MKLLVACLILCISSLEIQLDHEALMPDLNMKNGTTPLNVFLETTTLLKAHAADKWGPGPISRGKSLCIGIDSHTDLYFHKCDGSKKQLWTLKANGHITNAVIQGKCLKADKGFWPKVRGDCTDSADQKWVVSKTGQIMNQGNCLLGTNRLTVTKCGKNDNFAINYFDVKKDAHDSISNILTDIKKSIQNELKSATNTATKECTKNTKATVVVVPKWADQKKDFKFDDLTGCAAGSECETTTEAQQNIAVAAHKELLIRTAVGEKLAGELKSLQTQEAAKRKEKAALEKEIVDDGKLHKARMAKFTKAITSLTKINEHLINTGEIKMPTLLEEEKNVIGNFKLGKVMLLMLHQASTAGGVKEKELVNTLKKLLASCINSLEDSKKLEKEKHDNWVKMKQSKIKGCADAIADLISDKAATAAKIIANDKLIAAEELKKKNALAVGKTERDSCVKLHKTFVAAVKNHKSEIDAVDKMVEIVNDAKLNANTQAIRDETDKTKHGVKESVEHY